MSEWQPIEMAPKDTLILTWGRDGRRITAWQGEIPVTAGYRWEPWMAGRGWVCAHSNKEIRPTDWMPLPEPPAATPSSDCQHKTA